MTMHTGPDTDDTLRRDIAILSTLAHLHCATVLQLHALCFPYQTLATARITLHYLAEANFVIRTCWRLKRETRERGQVWTLTAKGHDLLRRYVHDVPALTFLDLARPSTSLEHEEWRVRLQVRTLVLRLLLEARRAPLLQCLDVLLPTTANWPTSWGGAPQVEPDALISIVWQPGTRKGGEWLPWLDVGILPTTPIRYPIFVQRTHSQAIPTESLPTWAAMYSELQHIPVVVLRNEVGYTEATRQLTMLAPTSPIRLTTWAALHGDSGHKLWWDARGAASTLRLESDEQAS